MISLQFSLFYNIVFIVAITLLYGVKLFPAVVTKSSSDYVRASIT